MSRFIPGRDRLASLLFKGPYGLSGRFAALWPKFRPIHGRDDDPGTAETDLGLDLPAPGNRQTINLPTGNQGMSIRAVPIAALMVVALAASASAQMMGPDRKSTRLN